MTAIYNRFPDGTISLKDGCKAFGVDIPAYVYDLWGPLIGIDVIGVFGMLCRLARDNKVQFSIEDLSSACAEDDKTFRKHLRILKTFQFIRMRTPNEQMRRLGIKTTIYILDAPSVVTPAHIEYAINEKWTPRAKGWSYRPLVRWLIDDAEADAGEEQEWDEIADLFKPEDDQNDSEEEDQDESTTQGNIPQYSGKYPFLVLIPLLIPLLIP